MTEVFPGIHELRVPLPHNLFLGYVNVYLIAGNDGYLMVDTGWNDEKTLDTLQALLSEIGLSFKDISRIASTHHHTDHYGLASKLKKVSGAKTILHEREEQIFTRSSRKTEIELDREFHWLRSYGLPESVLDELMKGSLRFASFIEFPLPDVTLQDGDVISTGKFNFKVILTAGHAPGHICFYEPDKKILISGDHVLPTITPHIGIHPYSNENPLGDYISSLKKVAELEVETVMPAHGEVFHNLKQRVGEVLQHHEHRTGEAVAGLSSNPTTPYEAATKMTWHDDIGGMPFERLIPMDKRLATLEAAAHLEAEYRKGKIKKSRQNGFICYNT